MTDKITQPMRILSITAHPDDSEFSVAGSMAQWIDDGAEGFYCIVTDGSSGSNEPDQNLAELVRIRHAEQRAAAKVLGVQEVIFLDFPDGTLEPTMELRRELTRVIRRIKPDRVIVSDPTEVFYGDSYINHPDHRAAAEAAIYAVFPSAVSRPIFPELLAEGLEPHQVKELYIWGSASSDMHIDISKTMERKIESLRCHKSQVDPGDGQWLRDWAAETAKDDEFEYAEAFRVMRLVNEDE
ncbi:MAG: PIG-L deacetylase family protein [Chloroflexota bacterium]